MLNKSKDILISVLLFIFTLAGFVMLGLGDSLEYYLQFESFSAIMEGWEIAALAMLAIGGVMLLAQILRMFYCVVTSSTASIPKSSVSAT